MTAFATELQKAMTRRGVKRSPLADRVGYGRSNLNRIIAGQVLPSVADAERLADALDWPSLATIALAERTGTCVLCGATYVRAPRGHARRFCSQGCKNAAHMRRAREAVRQRTLTETRMVRQRLDAHQLAVAAFCRQCEPEGMCRDAACPLRSVSPLPLARKAAA